MTITDETLMAYVDGELDAEARSRIEREILQNPELARKVERQRKLRGELQAAFGGVLEETVPQRLIDAARHAPAEIQGTNVTNLANFRRSRAAPSLAEESKGLLRRRWSWPEWGAMAASVLIGLLLGLNAIKPWGGDPISTQDGRLVARADLARALSDQVAGESTTAGQVKIALSFRDHSGRYCRAFSLQNNGGLAGLACREDNTWRIQLMTSDGSGKTDSGGYRMAGTALPQSVLQAVEDRIAGEPLDADGEAVARRNGWQ